MDIRGKVAIVTGGASGIGAGLAKRFAAEGARGVVVADVNLERAQGVAGGIGAVAVRCDVSREADIRALVATTRERFGQVDIFMSNAGILILLIPRLLNYIVAIYLIVIGAVGLFGR